MDFKGYELANDSDDSVPDGSLDHISTKFEVFIVKLKIFQLLHFYHLHILFLNYETIIQKYYIIML